MQIQLLHNRLHLFIFCIPRDAKPVSNWANFAQTPKQIYSGIRYMLFSKQIAGTRCGLIMIPTNSFSFQHLASGTSLYPDRQRLLWSKEVSDTRYKGTPRCILIKLCGMWGEAKWRVWWGKMACVVGKNGVCGEAKWRVWRSKMACVARQNGVCGGAKCQVWRGKI